MLIDLNFKNCMWLMATVSDSIGRVAIANRNILWNTDVILNVLGAVF